MMTNRLKGRKATDMKYDILNGTNDKISRIVLGTDVYGSVLDAKTAVSLLDNYCEWGGNVVDTASMYGGEDEHLSEKLIGKWLKEKKNRSNLFISTKGGHPRVKTMHISRLSKEEIENDMDTSLLNLGVDYVDIYWLHRDDERLDVEDIMNTLDMLVKKGKTRYIGMSNWTHKRIEAANKYAKENNMTQIISSQIQYSIAKPIEENNDSTLVLMNDDEYEYFKNHDLSVFAFSAQAKGFFSKMAAGGVEALSEKARHLYLSDENVGIYENAKTIAQRHGVSVGEVAISALISNNKFQTFPIIGCKNPEQLRDTMNGGDLVLSQEECEFIMQREQKTI